jgi:endonuclease YncB( thermonuclease family)
MKGLLLRLLPVLVASLAFSHYSQCQTDIIKGRATVLNGDTLTIEGATILLDGIDAFEAEQACKAKDGQMWACGKSATAQLKNLIEGKFTVCYVERRSGANNYAQRSTSATCESNGININRWMVNQGLAVANRTLTGVYIPDENMAREQERGGWRGTFRAPWEWRKQRPLSQPQSSSKRRDMLYK